MCRLEKRGYTRGVREEREGRVVGYEEVGVVVDEEEGGGEHTNDTAMKYMAATDEVNAGYERKIPK
jgi:hypothetical protein